MIIFLSYCSLLNLLDVSTWMTSDLANVEKIWQALRRANNNSKNKNKNQKSVSSNPLWLRKERLQANALKTKIK